MATGKISLWKAVFNKFNIIGIILLSLFLASLFLFQDIKSMVNAAGGMREFFTKAILYNLIYTAVIWLGCVVIIYYLDQLLPWKTHVMSRLLVQTITILGFATVANVYLCDLINIINHTPIINSDKLWNNLVISWIATIFVNMLWAGIYFFKQWKLSLVEAETLKKEQLRTQYELLKNQVNPHFLFNALNTLSTLIDEDTKKASQFVNNMADVYRYVLTARDSDTVSLKEELDCLKSFVFLNQMRFGDNLVFDWNISNQYMQKRVIPMGLQLLVENAIKHNEISRLNPLTIQIFSTEEGIVIENKIHKKMSVPGTGMGLRNLELRHQGTGDGILPRVENDGNTFTVFVPFITIHHENSNH